MTVWLWQTRREIWVLFVVGLPTIFMYLMSTWALGRMIVMYLQQLNSTDTPQKITYVLLAISLLLLVLALAMLVEAVIALTRSNDTPERPNPALNTVYAG